MKYVVTILLFLSMKMNGQQTYSTTQLKDFQHQTFILNRKEYLKSKDIDIPIPEDELKRYSNLKPSKYWIDDFNKDLEKDIFFQVEESNNFGPYTYYLLGLITQNKVFKTFKLSLDSWGNSLQIDSVKNGQIYSKFIGLSKSAPITFIINENDFIDKNYLNSKADKITRKDVFTLPKKRLIKFNNFFEKELSEIKKINNLEVRAVVNGSHLIFIKLEIMGFDNYSNIIEKKETLKNVLSQLSKNTTSYYCKMLKEINTNLEKTTEEKIENVTFDNGLKFTLSNGFTTNIYFSGIKNEFLL